MIEKNKSNELFNKYSDYVKYQVVDCSTDSGHDYYKGVMDAHMRVIGDFLEDIDRESAILDSGCGYGFSLDAFKHHGFNNVIGTDLSDARLHEAEMKGHSVRKLDMHDLADFADGSLDVVYSSHALEHALYPDKVLSEFFRVLKPDGVFLLVLPFPVILADEHTKKAHCGADFLKLTNAISEASLIKTVESFRFQLQTKGLGDYRGESEIYLKFVKTDKDSLRVLARGPEWAIAGQGFNVQPNGYSAMWFKIDDNYLSNIIVKYNGLTLKVSRHSNIISALLPDFLLLVPGEFDLLLFDEDVPERKAEFKFRVEDSNEEVVPNLFLIGAPRSGTTTLYWRLNSHYLVHMSRLKEPFHFDKRAYGVLTNVVEDSQEYMSLFKNAPFYTKFVGEASTTYFSSTEALLSIRNFNNDAKIIVMLRNPITAAFSMFLQICRGKVYENTDSFETAWRECTVSDRQPFVINYKKLYRIGDQLEKAMEIFGSNLKVIFFDDLVADSSFVVKDMFDFLELPIDAEYALEKTNSSNFSNIRAYLSGELIDEMKAYYYDQIQKVAQLTGRNLDHWAEI